MYNASAIGEAAEKLMFTNAQTLMEETNFVIIYSLLQSLLIYLIDFFITFIFFCTQGSQANFGDIIGKMKIIDYILLSLIWLIILFLFGCVYYVMFIIRY